MDRVDSRTAATEPTGDPVRDGLALIKDNMPRTYADIQAQAGGPRGRATFALVRRGLRGEANCFYAVEAGHVVGAPFNQNVTADAAAVMVQFGAEFVVMWPWIGEVQHEA